MAIVIPRDYRNLCVLTSQALAQLQRLQKEIEDLPEANADEWADMCIASVVHFVELTETYLTTTGQVARETVATEASNVREQDLTPLASYRPSSEPIDALKEGVLQIAEAAIMVCAPLAPNPAMLRMIDRMEQHVANKLTYNWTREDNRAAPLIFDLYRQAYRGEIDVPLGEIVESHQVLQQFTTNITGYGGPSVGLSDDEIRAEMKDIMLIGDGIIQEAESRLPQDPRPSRPLIRSIKDEPIFPPEVQG